MNFLANFFVITLYCKAF